MKKGTCMFQQSGICVLGLICAIFWIYLSCFHLGVFEVTVFSVSTEKTIQDNPVSISEILETNKSVSPFMKAMRSVENKSDPCGGRYVYIHDLPSRFNEEMVKECGSINKWEDMCKGMYTMNNGFGPLLNDTEGVLSDNGWYATDHYTLEIIFHSRLKKYECLTHDSSLASAIFVPFYAGFDAARYLWGYNISVRDATSIELVEWLQKRDEWKYMNGKDHFLVTGRPTWEFRRLTDEESAWGNKFMLLPAVKNMSMLTTESDPYSANDFSVPFATYFHPFYDYEVLDWQNRMMKMERKWLFSFAGAPRPGDPKSVRSLLIDQCKSSSVGKLLDCGVGDKKCHTPSSVMKMFQSSIFCLQPRGDCATRRSSFDSILGGCIPVFFHPSSFYIQYTWHIPRDYTKYSVFISEDEIRNNTSIEQRLSRIDPQQIKMMRKEVIDMIPRLIYADPHSKLETEDAFDIALKAIIHKVAKLRQDMTDGNTDEDFTESNSWKYALLKQGN